MCCFFQFLSKDAEIFWYLLFIPDQSCPLLEKSQGTFSTLIFMLSINRYPSDKIFSPTKGDIFQNLCRKKNIYELALQSKENIFLKT